MDKLELQRALDDMQKTISGLDSKTTPITEEELRATLPDVNDDEVAYFLRDSEEAAPAPPPQQPSTIHKALSFVNTPYPHVSFCNHNCGETCRESLPDYKHKHYCNKSCGNICDERAGGNKKKKTKKTRNKKRRTKRIRSKKKNKRKTKRN